VEFFLGFSKSIDEDLLRAIEEFRSFWKMLVVFNTTFIALIPQIDDPSSFPEFRPISLCNYIYKIVEKIIAMRVKNLKSVYIYNEQFSFLPSKQIHEAIGVAQEGLHSTKTKQLQAMVAKLDLSKAYDRASWLYLRMMLLHLSFSVHFVNWVMTFVDSIRWAIVLPKRQSVNETSGKGF
jgi:hypothetical protein